ALNYWNDINLFATSSLKISQRATRWHLLALDNKSELRKTLKYVRNMTKSENYLRQSCKKCLCQIIMQEAQELSEHPYSPFPIFEY
uniref:Uncharacterized protein n=1 Tax=Romanomermis culicivorax TaxID=13658 RepID=A0A915IP86_ROMCU